MLLWKITIKLFNELDSHVEDVIFNKDFATQYAAEKFGIEQGEKIAKIRPGIWFLVEVE